MGLMADRGSATNKDVTDSSGMDKASVSRAIKYLEEKKLIKQLPASDLNRRSKPYGLTSQGIKVFNEIAAQKLVRADELWSDLTKAEQKKLIYLLQKLKKNVNRVLND